MTGGIIFFLSTKLLQLLIINNILQIFTFIPSYNLNNFNLETAFKVTYIGFMRLKKLIYTTIKKMSFV